MRAIMNLTKSSISPLATDRVPHHVRGVSLSESPPQLCRRYRGMAPIGTLGIAVPGNALIARQRADPIGEMYANLPAPASPGPARARLESETPPARCLQTGRLRLCTR